MRRAARTTLRESPVVRAALRVGAAVLLGWALSAAAQSQGQGTVVSVSISSPASGAVVTAPGNVTLTAAASVNHPNWVVLRVEYYAGTALIGSATSAPYAFTWSNVAAGSYSLSAKAIATNPGQARQDPATHPNMPTWVGVSAPVTFRVKAVAQVYYIHPDHLNTPRFIADATQKIVWRWDQQEPFGATPPNDDPDGDGVKFDFPLRFPGQYFDRETNLSYNYFRDYDAGIGRYIQSDPIGLRGGMNLYAYVKSNPLHEIDPLGLCDCKGGIWDQEIGDWQVSLAFGGYISRGKVNLTCRTDPRIKCTGWQTCIGGGGIIGGGITWSIAGTIYGAPTSGDLSGWSGSSMTGQAGAGLFGGGTQAPIGAPGGSAGLGVGAGGGIAYINCYTSSLTCTNCCP